MYCEYFGLREPPFRITPDTRLFFDGGNRGVILDALVYCLARGEGIVKVVGEVGTGKTMLCRMLERNLPQHVEVVYLANPRLCPADVPHAIATEMGVSIHPRATRLEVMRVLQARLVAKHAAGRQVVVFIEEAQSMPLQTLEEVRLLSNLETQQHKLLQMVLFGQPELEQKIAATEIRQLRERITQGFELPVFREADIREYLDFRMRAVGYRGPTVFGRGAVRRIARASRGLTRRVNILADKALLAAFASGSHHITPRHVRAAVRDSEFSKSWRQPRRRGAAALSTTALAGAALLLVSVTQSLRPGSVPEVDDQASVPGEDAIALVGARPHSAPPAATPVQRRGTVTGRDAQGETTGHTAGSTGDPP
ncbi:MAG: AAA family ATPase [Gammaproteobacteria bacterium]|nr:AAA family ATPase [Gammaproteobacteria bacterium]MDJ0872320.1 AAA family ATPase [Gammaproteobacteria bacterium]